MTSSVVADQVAQDERHSATELVEVLHHCNAVRASADYRMLQAVSLIHEEREQDYLVRLAAGVGTGEVTSLAELEKLAVRAVSGEDPRARYGPTGFECAIAEVGAALTVPPARARQLIEAGSVLRHQLPFTGATLCSGRIDLERFLMVVRRTELCDVDQLDLIDTLLSEAIETREPMSMTRFRTMIDTIIAQNDPGAVKRRRELVDDDRGVSVRPDRHTPGQSRLSGSLPAAHAATVDATLTAMAATVHPGDPRTRTQLRADALVALASGHRSLTCRCEECVTPPEGADALPADPAAPEVDTADTDTAPADTHTADTHTADTDTADTDAADTGAIDVETVPTPPGDAVGAPRPTFHIVVNLSTLLGHDEDPAFLDGHGVIDADTARSLLTEARRRYVRPDMTAGAQSIERYAPSTKLADLVRAGELCCSFPGCNNKVWHADLDHSVPHGAGGLTHEDNLKPLCRFHHRMKTFGIGWRDYHDPLGTVFFQSPTGHTYLGNAFTGRDLFASLDRRGSPPDHPARQRIDTLRNRRAATIKRADQRAIDRWNNENPPPF